MKKIFLLASLGLFTLTSCTKEEETGSREFPQELLIDDTRYELGEGFIVDYGTSPSYKGSNLALNVLSSGLNTGYDAAGFPDTILGTGFVFLLEMYSPDSTFLSPGVYAVDSVVSGNLLTISRGAAISIGEANPVEYNFVKGSVEVILIDEVYTFVGSFTASGGNEIKFSYQNKLAVFQI
tara:strand:+ start:360 stop:899 length:540 start_codon:yes stop_codon:yes gene_type:complete